MVEDARFEDGAERPLALRAMDAGDLEVMSALVQDAVFPITELKHDAKRRQFAILLNRFRWEDGQRRDPPERVQSVLVIEDVMKVASQGFDRTQSDLVLSLLALEWIAGEDGTGRLTLVLAGEGALALDVEAIGVTLKDVTRPYLAPSRKTPDHPA